MFRKRKTKTDKEIEESEKQIIPPSNSVKVLGGVIGGTLFGWAVAGPSGAITGGFLGLLMGVSSGENNKLF